MKRKRLKHLEVEAHKSTFSLWDISGLPAVPNRRLVRDFLLPALDHRFFGRYLEWIDNSRTSFRILYHHKNAKSWSKHSAKVFKAWDLMKEREDSSENEYYTKARQRFKAALQKCRIIEKTSPSSEKHIEIYKFKTAEDRHKPFEIVERPQGNKSSPENIGKRTRNSKKRGYMSLKSPVKNQVISKRKDELFNANSQDHCLPCSSRKKQKDYKLTSQDIKSHPVMELPFNNAVTTSEAQKVAGLSSDKVVCDQSTLLPSVNLPPLSPIYDSRPQTVGHHSAGYYSTVVPMTNTFSSARACNVPLRQEMVNTFLSSEEVDEYLIGMSNFQCGINTSQIGTYVHHNE